MTDPNDRDVEQLLRGSREAGFGPEFAHRVMHRIDAERTDAALIQPTQFLRLAAAALVFAAAIAAFSVAQRAEPGQSAVEALFGLQPLNASAVFDAEAIYPVEAPS